MAIVGNKIDRYDDQEVNYSEVKEYANQNKAILKLVSAKEGKNITVIMSLLKDLFTSVAVQAVGLASKADKGSKLKPTKETEKKKSKCC